MADKSDPKQYGNLTADTLRQVVALLPVLEGMAADFRREAVSSPNVRKAVFEDGVWWAHLYDLPFIQHLGLCLKGLGFEKPLLEAVKRGNAQNEVLKWIADEDESLKVPEDFQLWKALSWVTSLERSLEALLVWGRYINELVAAARYGDDVSLFRAVRIDPTVVSCPSVAFRISAATVLGERSFLHALRHALEGRTQKQARYLRGVRLVVRLLHDGGVSSLSDRELVDLFVTSLGVYKQSVGGNAGKALRKHFQAAKPKTPPEISI